MYRYFAPCPRGLESVLALELARLGASGLAEVAGGVHFAGDRALCYRANLESRIASRVLWLVAEGGYRREQDIYALARDLDWSRLFDVDCTIRVDVTALRSPLKSIDFATLRIKDGICDRFRERTGRRPDVDTADPMVRIAAHLGTDRVTLYLDTSGEPLFKRGWRQDAGVAPLRENLAAGLLALAGWRPDSVLLDPMCGAGTIAIEAAQIAAGRPPGAARGFGFERLRGHDAALWRALRAARAGTACAAAPAIHGRDRDAERVTAARRNAAAAGVEDRIAWECADVCAAPAPAAAGLLVANPPYGVRLDSGAQLDAWYGRFGSALKRHYAGWSVWLLSGELQLPRKLGLRAERRAPLYNGALECRLFGFRMVCGSMRRARPDAD
jgi:putative N6-adenine-specific DNA methylase